MRKPWNQYFMDIADVVSTRSTCLRRKIGAIAVRDKNILSSGYNGAPVNLEHCLDIGCMRDELNIPSGQNAEICRACHAEQNVIAQAAKRGIDLNGATLYTTTFPCSMCAKMIVNAGFIKVIYREGYPDGLSNEILSNIELMEFK